MLDVVAIEKCVRTGLFRGQALACLPKIDNGRKIRNVRQALQHIEPIAIIVTVAEQDQVIPGAGEFVRQMASRNRVVCRYDRVRPKGRDMVHEKAAEIRIAVNDHYLDAHGRPAAFEQSYMPTAAPEGPSFE